MRLRAHGVDEEQHVDEKSYVGSDADMSGGYAHDDASPERRRRREAAQQEIFELIRDAWEISPKMRFGQLLINLGVAHDDQALWNVYDEKLRDHLRKRVDGWRHRRVER